MAVVRTLCVRTEVERPTVCMKRPNPSQTGWYVLVLTGSLGVMLPAWKSSG